MPTHRPCLVRSAACVSAVVTVLAGLVAVAAPAEAVATFVVTRPADTRDRFATAAGVAREAFPDGVPEVLVVNGDNPVDALAASAFAGPDLPILYVHRDSVPDGTAQVVADLAPDTVYVVGGTGVVSDAVARELSAGATRDVLRIAGQDRYETAAELAVAAAELSDEPPARVLLVRGDSYADALAAAPWAATTGFPILLTSPTRVPEITLAALEYLDPSNVTIVGGPSAVSGDLEFALREAGYQLDRIAGTDRYDTALAVARTAESTHAFTGGRVGLANGLSLVDALPGAVLLAQSASPILLTRPDSLGAGVETYLSDHNATLTSGIALGGTAAVPDALLVRARELAVAPPLRITQLAVDETTVTIGLPTVTGATAPYRVHLAPSRFGAPTADSPLRGPYLPAATQPPADARVAEGVDADPNLEGFQVTFTGLTAATGYDVWVTRSLPGLPPVVAYANGLRLETTRDQGDPTGPSFFTVPARPTIGSVVPTPDGTGVTVSVANPLPNSSYVVFYKKATTDEAGRYVAPEYYRGFEHVHPVQYYSTASMMTPDYRRTSTYTVTRLDPDTDYEIWIGLTNLDNYTTMLYAYWNGTTGSSQTTVTPVPTRASVHTSRVG